MLKTTISFIKDNIHYLALGTFTLLMLILHQYIYMYGDDYFYATFFRDGFNGFINKNIEHYMQVNGRSLIHILVEILLLWDVYVWRIVNPIIIFIFIILLSKVCTSSKDDNKLGIILGIILFSFLHIYITRQSIYWLDGSLNYLFPVVLMLLNLYLTRKSILQNKIYIYLPIIGFFSGATVDQVSLMTVGFIFLALLDAKFILKLKITKIHILNLVATAVGFATVYFAPGNSVRRTLETGYDYNNILASMYDNALGLLKLIFLSDGMYIYHMLLMLCVILWLYKYQQSLLNKFIIFFTSAAIFYYAFIKINEIYLNYNILNDRAALFTLIFFLFTYITSLLYCGILIILKEKQSLFLISLIIGAGAQAMLLFSPVYGHRTLLPTILTIFIPIIITLVKFKEVKWLPFAIIFILAVSSAKRLVLFLCLIAFIYLIYIIIKRFKNNKYIGIYYSSVKHLSFFIILILTLFMLNKNILGYKNNAPIHQYNLQKIQEYQLGSSKDELRLKELPESLYNWAMPYESSYHMSVFKIYYNIDKNTDVIFKK